MSLLHLGIADIASATAMHLFQSLLRMTKLLQFWIFGAALLLKLVLLFDLSSGCCFGHFPLLQAGDVSACFTCTGVPY